MALLITSFTLAVVTPSSVVALDASPGHETLACDSCHMRTAESGKTLAVENNRCLRCHDTTSPSSSATNTFHASENESCTTCHSFHRTEELKAGDTIIAYKYGDQSIGRHCVSCHAEGKRASDLNNQLSEGHRAAARIYHENGPYIAGLTPSEGCLLCHSKHGADALALKVVNSPPRFNEHASHPYGARVAPGMNSGGFRIRSSIDPRLALFEGRMECQTCHDVTDNTADLLVRFDQPTDMCLGCHQRTGSDLPALAVEQSPHRTDDIVLSRADFGAPEPLP
jgi:predicted CXXCH cytochrome family protein